MMAILTPWMISRWRLGILEPMIESFSIYDFSLAGDLWKIV